MSWNYSGDPRDSDKDAVRYLSRDTDDTDQLVQDEEILYELSESAGDVTIAAAEVCSNIATLFSRLADTKIGPVSESLSQKAKAYADRSKDLFDKAKKTDRPVNAEFFSGGTTKSGKQTLDTDTNAVQPNFRIGQDDNPRGQVDPDPRFPVP